MNLKRINNEYQRKIDKKNIESEEYKNQKFKIKELTDQIKLGQTSQDGFKNLTSRHNSTISDILPNLKPKNKNNLMKNKWRFNSNPMNSQNMYKTISGVSKGSGSIANHAYANEYMQPNRLNASSAIRSITPI